MIKGNKQPLEISRIRTWYGATAAIEIGNGFWHRAGFGRFLIPHPPLVNWVLRLGLPLKAKNRLSFIHEFGHLQTLPIYLLYLLVVIVFLVIGAPYSPVAWGFCIVSTHAFWEIITEFYTIHHAGPLYKLFYERVSLLHRFIFWIIMGIFSLSAWIIILA